METQEFSPEPTDDGIDDLDQSESNSQEAEPDVNKTDPADFAKPKHIPLELEEHNHDRVCVALEALEQGLPRIEHEAAGNYYSDYDSDYGTEDD